MASFTKKAIMASFSKLLEEKPLGQITIREIVEDCGVNRNTFYYHFKDLPHLVETMVNEETDLVICKFPAISSLRECLDTVIDFAIKNKKAVLHIYHSVNRDIFEQYQWKICNHAVTAYATNVLQDRKISDEDMDTMIEYIKCLLFGFVMHWMESGMDGRTIDKFHRICELKQGDLEKMIAQCER